MINPNIIQHHFFVPNDKKLTLHPEAMPAYEAWQQFQPQHSSVNLSSIYKYYKPIVRLVPHAKDHFIYFDSFERMSQILNNEAYSSQPFMVIGDDEAQVTTMAWAEVLKLSFYRGVSHQSLWQHLQAHCPNSILKALMNSVSDKLSVEDYCNFAGIDRDSYESS
ncbi:hypothetical protein [uncultured Psychrobacter sp.]|uniref:hypothetical protein n=1 Tax=uncultured Psychrobacter sp. TaxID=259303 RepID=UPI00345809B3